MMPDSLQKIGDEARRLLCEAMMETLHGSPDLIQTAAKAAKGKKLNAEYLRGMREMIRKLKDEVARSKALRD